MLVINIEGYRRKKKKNWETLRLAAKRLYSNGILIRKAAMSQN
jgi:hypothetical protein